MRKVEELLKKAKAGEKIIIDQQFKHELKKRLMPPVKRGSHTPVLWQRIVIPLVPIMTMAVLFVYFYEGEKNIPSPPVPREGKYEETAKVMDNRGAPAEYNLMAPMPSAGVPLQPSEKKIESPKEAILGAADQTTAAISSFSQSPIYQWMPLFLSFPLIISFVAFLLTWRKRRMKKKH